MVAPFERTIELLKIQYESDAKDTRRLADEVSRLTGLVDAMQDEASDSVRPLPVVGPGTASSPAESDTAEVVQTVSHRLVSMGVFTPRGEEGRRGSARVEPGGEESVDDSAESGAAEEPSAAEGVSGSKAAAPTDESGSGKDRRWKRPGAVQVPKFPL